MKRYLTPFEMADRARAERNRAAAATILMLAAIAAGLLLILHFIQP